MPPRTNTHNRLALVEALRKLADKPATVPLTFSPAPGGAGFVVRCDQADYLAAAKVVLDAAPALLAAVDPEQA